MVVCWIGFWVTNHKWYQLSLRITSKVCQLIGRWIYATIWQEAMIHVYYRLLDFQKWYMRKILSLLMMSICFIWFAFSQLSTNNPNSPWLPWISNPWLSNQASDAANNFRSSQVESINQNARERSWPWVCWEYALDDKEYIILNTNVPFVWRCIKKVFNEWDSETNVSNVFPKLMANMIRIVMVILVVWWFLWILVWGFMIAANWAFGTKQTWVKLILGVIAGLILLWASGILLNLINPNFFGAAS